jgi:hypothetical protein
MFAIHYNIVTLQSEDYITWRLISFLNVNVLIPILKARPENSASDIFSQIIVLAPILAAGVCIKNNNSKKYLSRTGIYVIVCAAVSFCLVFTTELLLTRSPALTVLRVDFNAVSPTRPEESILWLFGQFRQIATTYLVAIFSLRFAP